MFYVLFVYVFHLSITNQWINESTNQFPDWFHWGPALPPDWQSCLPVRAAAGWLLHQLRQQRLWWRAIIHWLHLHPKRRRFGIREQLPLHCTCRSHCADLSIVHIWFGSLEYKGHSYVQLYMHCRKSHNGTPSITKLHIFGQRWISPWLRTDYLILSNFSSQVMPVFYSLYLTLLYISHSTFKEHMLSFLCINNRVMMKTYQILAFGLRDLRDFKDLCYQRKQIKKKTTSMFHWVSRMAFAPSEVRWLCRRPRCKGTGT